VLIFTQQRFIVHQHQALGTMQPMVIQFQAPLRAKSEPTLGHSASVLDIRPKPQETADAGQTRREESMSILGRETEHLVRKAIFLAREHGTRREVYLLFLAAVRTIRGNLKGAM